MEAIYSETAERTTCLPSEAIRPLLASAKARLRFPLRVTWMSAGPMHFQHKFLSPHGGLTGRIDRAKGLIRPLVFR